jgi:outer membrane protein assembly factor BamB
LLIKHLLISHKINKKFLRISYPSQCFFIDVAKGNKKIHMKKSYSLPYLCLVLFPFIVPSTGMTQATGFHSWNQFRGPARSGTSQEIITFSEGSSPEARLVWKKPIGSGFSEMAVEGVFLFTMESEQLDSTSGHEFVSCYDNRTGEPVWKSRVDSLFFDEFGNGPRSTPFIGNHFIYSLSSYGKLSAHDKADGTLRWQVDLVEDFKATVPRWGFSTSPLMIGNTLVIEAGGAEGKAFVGFDSRTGTPAWSNGSGVASYCSPVLAQIDGVKQIIFANQQTLFSLNEEGDTLWTHVLSAVSPMAMPVFFDGDKVFVSSLQSKGFSILQIGEGQVREILSGKTMKNDFSSSLWYDGHFYGFDVAALQCISAETGEKKWTKRGLGKGSLILVGDILLALSDKGKLVLIKAEGDAYRELGSFQVLDGKSWTAPSYSEGRLYLRNLTEMACYEIN